MQTITYFVYQDNFWENADQYFLLPDLRMAITLL